MAVTVNCWLFATFCAAFPSGLLQRAFFCPETWCNFLFFSAPFRFLNNFDIKFWTWNYMIITFENYNYSTIQKSSKRRIQGWYCTICFVAAWKDELEHPGKAAREKGSKSINAFFFCQPPPPPPQKKKKKKKRCNIKAQLLILKKHMFILKYFWSLNSVLFFAAFCLAFQSVKTSPMIFFVRRLRCHIVVTGAFHGNFSAFRKWLSALHQILRNLPKKCALLFYIRISTPPFFWGGGDKLAKL